MRKPLQNPNYISREILCILVWSLMNSFSIALFVPKNTIFPISQQVQWYKSKKENFTFLKISSTSIFAWWKITLFLCFQIHHTTKTHRLFHNVLPSLFKAWTRELFKMMKQLIVIYRANPNPTKAHIPNFNWYLTWNKNVWSGLLLPPT